MKNLTITLVLVFQFLICFGQNERVIFEDIVQFDKRVDFAFDVNSVVIGKDAGLNIDESNASDNVFIGGSAGQSSTSGSNNVFLGNLSGKSNDTGSGNVFVGMQASTMSTASFSNVVIGFNAGFKTLSGQNNLFLGASSGFENESGTNNVYLGANAGQANVSGLGNIFIGANSGIGELGSEKLYIDNSGTATPLIYGDFQQDKLEFNGAIHVRDFMKLNPILDAPTSPEKGTIYYDKNDDKVKVWTGGTWEDLN